MSEELKYNELKSLVAREVNKIIDKGSLDPVQVHNISEALCMMEKAKECYEFADKYADEYLRGVSEAMNRSYRSRNSYERGYSDAMRDMDEEMSHRRSSVTGRFTSRDSYESGRSGHSVEDRVIANLEGMLNSASSEYDRRFIENEIRGIRSSMM